jgi:protocatechuate 3,4-dioxygenase beta subunit
MTFPGIHTPDASSTFSGSSRIVPPTYTSVDAPGHRGLTTQVYFAADPWLDHDVVGAAKPSLVTELQKATNTDNYAYTCRFDFLLNHNPNEEPLAGRSGGMSP